MRSPPRTYGLLVMKNLCPECDEPAPPRATHCVECGRLFAFRESSRTTDLEWSQLIEELSDQERLYFTTNQFFIPR